MFQCKWQLTLENATNAPSGIFYDKVREVKYKN